MEKGKCLWGGARVAAVAVGLLVAFWCFSAASVLAQEAAGGAPEPSASAEPKHVYWPMPVAIAASIGISCLAAAYAVAKVGAAALGAASERPELLTRGLLFVALAEGIAIYGVLIAFLLWLKL